MSDEPQRPPVDLSVLRESFGELGIGEDEIQELVGVFLADFPQGMRRLRLAVEQHDPMEILRTAHSLKSPAATLGAHRLAEILLRMECSSSGRLGLHRQEWLGEAEQEFDSVRRSLAGEFPELEPV